MLLDLDPAHRPVGAVAAGVAVAAAVVLLLVRPGRRRRATATLAAVLLTGAAAATATLLHTADLQRGPLVALAHSRSPSGVPVPGRVGEPAPEIPSLSPPSDSSSGRTIRPSGSGPSGPGPSATTSTPSRSELSVELSVELTVAADPVSRTSRARGTAPGQSLLTLAAVADRVTVPEGAEAAATTRIRTPVTVMVRAEDAALWRSLLPSTRLAADVRVLPAAGGYDDSAALLLAHGPPRLLAPPSVPQRIAGRLRAGLRSACDRLPEDARGLLPGLVVGDTSRLPDDLREAFRATDLAHLCAVSGANLMIVFTVLLGAPGRAGTPERGGLAARLGLSLRTTAFLGAVLTLAFVTVCRPDPSVLRAAATGLIGLLALAVGRPRHAVPALSGAVLVLVLVDPFLARSYGFLLSVLATTGLLVLGPRWTAALRARGWPTHLATGLAAAAAAQALCAPATILLAPRVSLVAVPCNLLAELAVAPATLLGFAVLAVAPFSAGLARLPAELAALPAGWLAAVARHGAALPGAQLSWPGGPAGAGALALATAAACAAAPLVLPPPRPADPPGGSRRRRTRAGRLRAPAVTALACALVVLLLRPPTLTRIATGWPPPGWRLAMCDIGQGDMLVLPVLPADRPDAATPDSAVVVDAGPDPNAADGCLRSLGITRVALLILTHFHADHVEGVPGVLRGRAVGAIEGTTLDEPAAEAARVRRWAAADGIPLLSAARGERRTAGPLLSWEVLWPDGAPGPAAPDAPGPNNASIALLATIGPHPTGPDAGDPSGRPLRVALLGDLEPPAQAALLTRLASTRVDVLKVAHHGSAHQDWGLAASLHPRLALVSCGRDNPYGHPASRTVDRLRALGATVLRTDVEGDIAVVGDTPAALGAATHPHERQEGRR